MSLVYGGRFISLTTPKVQFTREIGDGTGALGFDRRITMTNADGGKTEYYFDATNQRSWKVNPDDWTSDNSNPAVPKTYFAIHTGYYGMTITRNIAKDILTPPLKKLGFKSRGLTWNRRRGEFVDVINVQRSKGSSEIEESITVNVGIVIPEFLQVIFGKTPVFFNEADCIVRVRPNELETGVYGNSLDKWWDITQQNADQRANEIQFFILNKAVPFLESFEELPSVARYLDQLQGWQTKYPYIQISRALVLWRLGDTRYKEVLLGSAKAWEEQVANVKRWMQESSVT